jgi:ribosomal-protein-alanine N-acetyltransferase
VSALLATRNELTPMRDKDVDAVVAAEQRIYAFPWTRGNFTDSLQAGHSVWIYREADELVAYAVMMSAMDEVQVLNLSVVPEYRRRGLGSDLLVHLFAVARGHGATRMLLEVRAGNEPGQALYRRFLFSEIGRRRAYYAADNGREDAIVMAREL